MLVARAYDSLSLPPTSLAWVTDASIGGFVSATLVSSRLPWPYTGDAWHTLDRPEWGQVGVLLSSAAVRASLRCSYPHDARSRSIKCTPPVPRSACSPGCVGVQTSPAPPIKTPHVQGWCNRTHPSHACAHLPEELPLMLDRHEERVNRMLAGCPAPAEDKRSNDVIRKEGRVIGKEVRVGSRPVCSCASSRTCCRYPTCPLYNELILSARALAGLGASAINSVYYLEGDAAASNESAARAAAAARAMHASRGARGALLAISSWASVLATM